VGAQVTGLPDMQGGVVAGAVAAEGMAGVRATLTGTVVEEVGGGAEEEVGAVGEGVGVLHQAALLQGRLKGPVLLQGGGRVHHQKLLRGIRSSANPRLPRLRLLAGPPHPRRPRPLPAERGKQSSNGGLSI